MIVSRANLDEMSSMSRIHLLSFEIGILSHLPLDKLTNFYTGIFREQQPTVLVAKYDAEIIGFCYCIREAVSYRKFKPSLLWSLGKSCISNPRYLLNLGGNLQKFQSHESYLEIFSIAVLPKYQGLGVGTKLIEEVHKVCNQEGTMKVITKTHNFRLVDHYRNEYDARILSRTILGRYRTWLMEWDVPKLSDSPF